MANKTLKANKIISKAATSIDVVAVRIEQANVLLKKEIDKNSALNIKDEEKIKELQSSILERENQTILHETAIEENKELIVQLKSLAVPSI